jgi:S1/P1 Nuclease
MRFHTPLVFAAVLMCFTVDSLAWGPAGHKIIASIAFRRLARDKQATIIALLKQHPRYEEDFGKKMPAEVPADEASERIIQQAAIWPDLARGLKGDGLRQQYHHRTWHFIDLPDFLTPADEQALKERVKAKINLSLDVPSDPEAQNSMNIMQAIAHSQSIVVDPGAKPQDRALHLSWLIHLVGDLHQPLHTTALFSRQLFPDGDQGGNKIPTEQRKNLHSLWDGLPGSSEFAATRNRAIRLLGDPKMRELGERAAANQDVKAWLEESHQQAKAVAYDGEVTDCVRRFEKSGAGAELPRMSLSEGYLKQGGAVASRCVVEAGYRLGKMLEGVP